MYVSNKIVAHGVSSRGAAFVIIRADDYPNEPGMRRTTYDSNISRVVKYATEHCFSHESDPAVSRYYIGVEVERLRQFRPAWLITEDDLVAQYQAMQREESGPLKVDLRKDPELLRKAKELWSARLSAQIKAT